MRWADAGGGGRPSPTPARTWRPSWPWAAAPPPPRRRPRRRRTTCTTERRPLPVLGKARPPPPALAPQPARSLLPPWDRPLFPAPARVRHAPAPDAPSPPSPSRRVRFGPRPAGVWGSVVMKCPTNAGRLPWVAGGEPRGAAPAQCWAVRWGFVVRVVLPSCGQGRVEPAVRRAWILAGRSPGEWGFKP